MICGPFENSNRLGLEAEAGVFALELGDAAALVHEAG